jgi:hypothetical protein
VKEGQQVRSALAPAGAWLGTRLADLLAPAQRERADKASAGASAGQLQLAEAVVRAAVAAGTVRSVINLSVSMARRAARGEVDEVASPPPAAGTAQSNPWPTREQYAGWSVAHRRGTLVVRPGAQQFEHVGGELGGQVIGGSAAVKVWEHIDVGELTLQPPTRS